MVYWNSVLWAERTSGKGRSAMEKGLILGSSILLDRVFCQECGFLSSFALSLRPNTGTMRPFSAGPISFLHVLRAAADRRSMALLEATRRSESTINYFYIRQRHGTKEAA